VSTAGVHTPARISPPGRIIISLFINAVVVTGEGKGISPMTLSWVLVHESTFNFGLFWQSGTKSVETNLLDISFELFK
jgi:hypothetical protein